MDFFITGLPRSKTAWMSLYFTRDNHQCYHELLSQLGVKGCLRFETDLTSKFIGNSDSGLIAFYDRFMEEYPSAPWINVVRDRTDVRMSAVAYGIPEPNIRFAIKCHDEMRESLKGNDMYIEIPFNFSDLDLERACEHIGLKYNQDYTDYMKSYNVQMSEYQKKKLINNINLA